MAKSRKWRNWEPPDTSWNPSDYTTSRSEFLQRLEESGGAKLSHSEYLKLLDMEKKEGRVISFKEYLAIQKSNGTEVEQYEANPITQQTTEEAKNQNQARDGEKQGGLIRYYNPEEVKMKWEAKERQEKLEQAQKRTIIERERKAQQQKESEQKAQKKTITASPSNATTGTGCILPASAIVVFLTVFPLLLHIIDNLYRP